MTNTVNIDKLIITNKKKDTSTMEDHSRHIRRKKAHIKKMRKLTNHLVLIKTEKKLHKEIKKISKDVQAGLQKHSEALDQRHLIREKLKQIYKALNKWPKINLRGIGLKAMLHIQDSTRQPLLMADFRLLLQDAVLPYSVNRPPYRDWFANLRRVSQVVLLIVEGVSLNTFQGLGTDNSKLSKYHQRMLKDGLITLYSGDDKAHDAEQTTNYTKNALNKRIANDDISGQSPSKRPRLTITFDDTITLDDDTADDSCIDITEETNQCLESTVRTWLPSTCSLLSTTVEVTATSMHGHTVPDDLLLVKCSNVKLKDIRTGMCPKPKTLIQRKPCEDPVIEPVVKVATSDCKQSGAPSEGKQKGACCDGKQEDYSKLAEVAELHRVFNATNKTSKDTQYWGHASFGANVPDHFDRRWMLLSLEDLFVENYPMSTEIYDANEVAYERKAIPKNYQDFTPTKPQYCKVTANSPMFGVDCEFVTTAGPCCSLGSISIVNEAGKLVYHTLTKPKGKIISYNTKWSGLTKQLLDPVTTTLEDVQRQIVKKLPTDAILVGHSLGTDLRVMKMHHPYIIDTSVVYNTTGIKCNRSKLKTLAKLFLNRDIQMAKKTGHDPTEDAEAAIQLVQHKLKHDMTYGNRVLGGTLPALDNAATSFVDGSDYYYNLFECLEDTISPKFTTKKINILTTKPHIDNWLLNLAGLKTAIVPKVLASNEELIEAACAGGMEADVTIAHLELDDRLLSSKVKPRLSALAALDSWVARLHESVANKALVAVVLAGAVRDTPVARGNNGMVMLGIKGREEVIIEPDQI